VLERDAQLVSVRERDALQRAERWQVARILHATELRLRGAELTRSRALGETGFTPESHDTFRDRCGERVGTARLLGRCRCDRCWCRLVRHGDKRVAPPLGDGENVQKIGRIGVVREEDRALAARDPGGADLIAQELPLSLVCHETAPHLGPRRRRAGA
jgi:hypothetical protein